MNMQTQVVPGLDVDALEAEAMRLSRRLGPQIEAEDLVDYSIGRAIRAVLAESAGEGRIDVIAPFEADVSRHLADVFDRSPRGLLVPILRAPPMDSSSGLAVGPQTPLGFFRGLRQRLFTARYGARVVDGLVGDMQIQSPAPAVVSWVAEDAAPTDDEIAVPGVALTPRTVGALVSVTRRLLKQSDPPLDVMVWGELERAIAAEVDRAAVEGNGTTEPPGVAGTATQVTTVANNSPTPAEVATAEVELVNAGALGGAPADSVAWITASDTWGNLRVKQQDSGAGYMLREGRMLGGWPAEPFNLTTQKWVLGAWSRLFVGYWGVVDLAAEQPTGARAAKGGRLMSAFLDVATAAGQPAAFVTHN